MITRLITQQIIDDADDLLLDTVSAFVEAHGGVPSLVGGVELVMISDRKFSVCVHVEGFAPPLPGARADG